LHELVATNGASLGQFDFVVVTAPPAQAARLVEGVSPELGALARSAGVEPCLAAAYRVEGSTKAEFDAAKVRGGAISWLAREASKPGRAESDLWVVHHGPEASLAALSSEPNEIAKATAPLVAELVGATRAELVVAHRWRYARIVAPIAGDRQCAIDRQKGLGLAGDAFFGERLEGAFVSGDAMGRALRAMVG
jgi:hypothetical protein